MCVFVCVFSHQQLPTEDLQQSGEHVSISEVVVEVRYATGHSGQVRVDPLGKSLLLNCISFICQQQRHRENTMQVTLLNVIPLTESVASVIELSSVYCH